MKMGIITFHAAYNFGSVLQAYALQTAIEKMGYDCEIINYRLNNQKKYYIDLYSFKFGVKRGLASVTRILDHKNRKNRAKKFEFFINKQLNLSEKEYNCYEQLEELRLRYDILVTGSDQVWNINCPAEFYTEPPESILGYYLGFAEDKKKRISYAASTGDMTEVQLKEYVEYIKRYDHISVREPQSAVLLQKIIGRDVEHVLDPTFLLDSSEWSELVQRKIDGNYILFYSLGRPNSTNRKLREVKKFADKKNLKVYAITPFCAVKVKHVVELSDAGPIDFLTYLRNAKLVITDSFHGSALSINLNRTFYSLCSDNNGRIGQMLSKLNCTERMLLHAEDLENIDFYEFDFSDVNRRLEEEREKSNMYLRRSLSEAGRGLDKTWIK